MERTGGYSRDEVIVSAEGRAQRMVDEYSAVFDAIVMRLGVTADMVLMLKKEDTYVTCMNGTLNLSTDSLHSAYSLPYVLLKRLFPMSEQLRLLLATKDVVTHEPLFTHSIIQLMRCYASFTKFSPRFYTNLLFEWLVAQCVELSAILRMISSPTSREGGPSTTFAFVFAAVEWIQNNVAFVLTFARGSHLAPLLMDYKEGTDAISAMTADVTGTFAPVVSDEAVWDVMDNFKVQTTRLEQQVELFARHIKAAEKDGAPAHMYRSVTELLLDSSWRTVQSLCMSPKRVPELETVVQPLFHLFQLAGREMDLVHWAIDKDIGEGVKEAALLFRVPSTATRLLRCVFFNSDGAEYLRSILTAPLRKLAKQKVDVELDPNRLPFDVDAATKAELLKGSAKVIVSVADSVFQAAFKSIETVPIMIRKFLLYARNTFMSAHQKGAMDEDAATKLVVASLYFLRFVIPALVAPHAFGVTEVEPPPELQRALVLVAKVLQNTASGVEFDGSKEQYMAPCNAFVVQNQTSALKLFNMLIDAQSIGTRELKSKAATARHSRKAANKRDMSHALQEEMEERVAGMRDAALIVNEFALKRSFLPMLSVATASAPDDGTVRTARALIKADLKLHEQRAPTRVEPILSASMKLVSPYSAALQATVAEMAVYLPTDLVVFKEDDIGPSSYNSSDTVTHSMPVTHAMLLLDTVTAHRPSRLANVARMLRSSCQEVWEAGMTLRDLVVVASRAGSFAEVVDQDSPVAIMTSEKAHAAAAAAAEDMSLIDTDDTDDSSASSSLDGMYTGGAASFKTSAQKGKFLSMLRGNSGSTGRRDGDAPPTLNAPGHISPRHSGSNITISPSVSIPSSPIKGSSAVSLPGSSPTATPSPATSAAMSKARKERSSSFLSPFSSPMRSRKKKTCRPYGQDEALLWAAGMVLPQALGLLHAVTMLRQTLKHARLENRIVVETADVDSVVANCVFEFSRQLKLAGSQLLCLVVADPTNVEIGNLGLAIANSGVLLTRSALQLMNMDRQVLRAADVSGKHDRAVGGAEGAPKSSSAGGSGGGSGGNSGAGSGSNSVGPRLKRTKKRRPLTTTTTAAAAVATTVPVGRPATLAVPVSGAASSSFGTPEHNSAEHSTDEDAL